VSWTETPSLSFIARHEASHADGALAVLESLEAHRERLEGLFPRVPANVTVILHDSTLQLSLAQPLWPLARRLSSPAGRRYMAGWFSREEVHVLAPHVLRRMAAGPESLHALMLAPERSYTQLVIGLNNPSLPPPFHPRNLSGLARRAWIAEGAAQHFCGQLRYLRAPIARRLRGRPPRLPPGARDAPLLGGSVFELLERDRGPAECVRLALDPAEQSPEAVVEKAFDSPLADVRLRWRSLLEELARAEPAVDIAADG
jgi:hypothetical protein